MPEHGNANRNANSGRGIHGILGHADVANGAARVALVQTAADDSRFVKQTAGDVPGYYMGNGAGLWYLLDVDPFVVSPASLSVDVDDYQPVSAEAWQYGMIFRLSSSAAVRITGFAAIPSAPRRIRQIFNVNPQGGDPITIGHLDVGSAAGNRVFVAGAADLVLPPGANATLWDDVASALWRVM